MKKLLVILTILALVLSAAALAEYIGDSTVVLNYEDGMILPGFADAHSHGHSKRSTSWAWSAPRRSIP